MSPIILAVMPFISSGIVSLFKRIKKIDRLDEKTRVATIRLANAVLAIVTVTTLYALGGDPITNVQVEEVVLSLMAFLSTDGAHNLLKGLKKKG